MTAAAVALSGWQGSDYPAQLYRVEHYRQAGMSLWDRNWYGGHYTLGYSVLFPPLAAWLGVTTVGVLSTVAATGQFAALARTHFRRAVAPATAWFAVAMVVNLLIGRLTFALGVAFALGAILAHSRQHPGRCTALAAASGLASPVAGVIVALAGAGIASASYLRAAGLGARLRRAAPATAMAFAASAPPAVLAVLFPSGGIFPFRGGHLVGVVATGLGMAILLPRRFASVRICAAFVALVAVPLFLIDNPLGGNLIRMPILFAWPILAGALWHRRRHLVVLAAIPLAGWMVFPVVVSASTYTDPSAQAEFYEPVITTITERGGEIGRLEIPFTEGHWETAFVAPAIPLARGWERQTDMAANHVLYDESLDAGTYHRWLHRHAVRYIAVPEVSLDHGGQAEADLLASTTLPWLEIIYRDADWTIYEVLDATSLVEAPGRLLRNDPTGPTIAVDAPGTIRLRETYNPYWVADRDDVCVREAPDGQTDIVAEETGIVRLRLRFSFDAAVGPPPSC